MTCRPVGHLSAPVGRLAGGAPVDLSAPPKGGPDRYGRQVDACPEGGRAGLVVELTRAGLVVRRPSPEEARRQRLTRAELAAEAGACCPGCCCSVAELEAIGACVCPASRSEAS